MIIERITYPDGPPCLTPIYEDDWDRQCIIAESHGLKLTEYNALTPNMRSDGRYASKDFRIIIEYQGGYWREYKFSRWWRTDLASVPWFLRGFVDNSGNAISLGALCHDADFTLKKIDFTEANRQLERVCDYYGMNWFRRRAVFLSVQTVGYIVWHIPTEDTTNDSLVSYREVQA